MTDRSGIHRRTSTPTTYYVRERSKGFYVFMEGRESPLSLHYTRDAALALAESLAKASGSRVSIENLARTGT
jgi:hypothetical protein